MAPPPLSFIIPENKNPWTLGRLVLKRLGSVPHGRMWQPMAAAVRTGQARKHSLVKFLAHGHRDEPSAVKGVWTSLVLSRVRAPTNAIQCSRLLTVPTSHGDCIQHPHRLEKKVEPWEGDRSWSVLRVPGAFRDRCSEDLRRPVDQLSGQGTQGTFPCTQSLQSREGQGPRQSPQMPSLVAQQLPNHGSAPAKKRAPSNKK